MAAVLASVCPDPAATCGLSEPRASKVFARRYGETFRARTGPITFHPRGRMSARASASCACRERWIASRASSSPSNHWVGSSSFNEPQAERVRRPSSSTLGFSPRQHQNQTGVSGEEACSAPPIKSARPGTAGSFERFLQ